MPISKEAHDRLFKAVNASQKALDDKMRDEGLITKGVTLTKCHKGYLGSKYFDK
jgi:hypothetical protein